MGRVMTSKDGNRRGRLLGRAFPLIVCLGLFLPMTHADTPQSSDSATTVAAQEKAYNDRVQKIVQLLDECPVWARLEPSDTANREKIMSCLAKIQDESGEVIRDAIKKYMLKHSDPVKGAESDAYGTIFVLNRYLFKVPVSTPLGKWAFCGLIGVPIDRKKKTFNSLWPFSEDRHGHLTLGGRYGAFNGPPYQFLDEFDYFHIMYGWRNYPHPPAKP